MFHTDNISHFTNLTPALLYAEVTDRELVVRKYATSSDAWLSGAWLQEVWRVPLVQACGFPIAA